MARNALVKQRHTRFSPDPGTLAEIRFEEKGITVFGLVLNESAGGFAVVVSIENEVPEGTICQCKVGNLGWAQAEVRWSKMVDKNLVKIGLEYHL
jgi:hypothetical protein